MKKSVTIIISFLLVLTLSAQVNFNNNTVSAENYSSALGVENISTGVNSFAAGCLNEATGDYSVAMPLLAKSVGQRSLAFGYNAVANGSGSVALGTHSSTGAEGLLSIAIGSLISTNVEYSMVVGFGNADSFLINDIENSLMIGFNSNKPTFFVGTASGIDKTGKVGIGNITAPTAKLHIKADDNENASLKLEPTGSGYEAQILMGDDLHKIIAKPNDDFKFSLPSGRNFVFENGKIKTTGFQLTDGQQGEGRYLQSDTDGNASWATSNVPCLDCLASGEYSSTIGKYDTATGDMAFAGGYHCKANGVLSFSFGAHCISDGTYAVTFGHSLESYGLQSMVIGTGASVTNKLTNGISQSLMIGFGSEKPTLFVGPTGPGLTGKIGIGDVTDPQAKLHIKGDQDEQVSLFLEPYQFGGSYDAELWMGTEDYGLRAACGRMYFNTGGNYIFNSADANVGIGTLNPLAKLQVNGDVFIEDENAGLILKSPDGQCWKITVNNSGQLTTTSIDCNLTTGEVNTPQPEKNIIRIYPNPAKNSITIENTYNYIVYATLRDMDGTLIITQKLQTGDNTLNIEALATGTYIITILDSQNQMISSEKIMKK